MSSLIHMDAKESITFSLFLKMEANISPINKHFIQRLLH